MFTVIQNHELEVTDFNLLLKDSRIHLPKENNSFEKLRKLIMSCLTH